MELISFFTIFLSIASLLTSFVFIFVREQTQYFPAIMIIFMGSGLFFGLIGIFSFWSSFRFFIKRLNQQHFNLSKRMSKLYRRGNHLIKFDKCDGVWVCALDDKKVFFDLRGCFFQKSFLVAFVIRAIRYHIVSEKMPLRCLDLKRLGGLKPSMRVSIEFTTKNNTKKYVVVKNGESICWVIARVFIHSKLFQSSLQYGRPIMNMKNYICYIDEESFVKQYW